MNSTWCLLFLACRRRVNGPQKEVAFNRNKGCRTQKSSFNTYLSVLEGHGDFQRFERRHLWSSNNKNIDMREGCFLGVVALQVKMWTERSLFPATLKSFKRTVSIHITGCVSMSTTVSCLFCRLVSVPVKKADSKTRSEQNIGSDVSEASKLQPAD